MNLSVNEHPIALYDVDNTRLIGIFKFQWIVARYLWGQNADPKRKSLYQSVKNKSRIHHTNYPNKVTLRFATIKQASLLEDKLYFINDDSLLKFDTNIMRKYHSTRIELAKEQKRA